MWIISREKKESITINHNVVITVVDIRGNKVRLGIQAPKEISVHRTENEEKDRAAHTPPPPPP